MKEIWIGQWQEVVYSQKPMKSLLCHYLFKAIISNLNSISSQWEEPWYSVLKSQTFPSYSVANPIGSPLQSQRNTNTSMPLELGLHIHSHKTVFWKVKTCMAFCWCLPLLSSIICKTYIYKPSRQTNCFVTTIQLSLEWFLNAFSHSIITTCIFRL